MEKKELLKMTKKQLREQMVASQQKSAQLISQAQEELGVSKYCKFIIDNFEVPEE